jgi:hypothetical protein
MRTAALTPAPMDNLVMTNTFQKSSKAQENGLRRSFPSIIDELCSRQLEFATFEPTIAYE